MSVNAINMAALVDCLYQELKTGECILVPLDLSAAFKSTGHVILLNSLSGMGSGGICNVLQWHWSFLGGEACRVVVKDSCQARRALLRDLNIYIVNLAFT